MLRRAPVTSQRRGVGKSERFLASVLLGCILVVGAVPTEAAEIEEIGGPVSAIALDDAIEEVLAQREYAWRMPRESSSYDLESLNWLADFRDWLNRWLEELLPDWTPWDFGSEGLELTGLRKLLETLMAILLAGILGWIIWRVLKTIRQRRRIEEEASSHSPQRIPDLRRDDVSADELPSSAWLNLARELMEKGEYRLALRAFYLSQLAQLADQGLIVLRRFKSNYDYLSELRRRAHADPELADAFRGNSGLFERSWYGNHPVSEPQIAEFHRNLRKMNLGEK